MVQSDKINLESSSDGQHAPIETNTHDLVSKTERMHTESQNVIQDTVEVTNKTPKKSIITKSSPRRSPDIERIAKFFKKNKPSILDNNEPLKNNGEHSSDLNNQFKLAENSDRSISQNKNIFHSPSKERATVSENKAASDLRLNILNKLNYSSDEDTPPSQRKTINLEQNILNPTNIVSRLKNAQKEFPEFNIPEDSAINNGIEINYNMSDDAKGLESNRMTYSLKADQPISKYNSVNSTQVMNTQADNNQILSSENPKTLDYSVIDDTTDANITTRWINNSENEDTNGNNLQTQLINTVNTQNITFSPTQIIDTTLQETSEINTQSVNTATVTVPAGNSDKIEVLSADGNFKLKEFSTQILPPPQLPQLRSSKVFTTSPNKILSENTEPFFNETKMNDSRSVFGKSAFSQQPADVSYSKYPIRNKHQPSLKMTDSSPTPRNNSDAWENNQLSEFPSSGKIFLQVSNKTGLHLSQNSSDSSYLDTYNNLVVASEAEMTQELPEMDENTQEYMATKDGDLLTSSQYAYSNASKDEGSTNRLSKRNKTTPNTIVDDHTNVKKRSKVYANAKQETLVSDLEKSNIDNDYINFTSTRQLNSSPSALVKTHDFPHSLLSNETHTLTKDDIEFDNSVLCFYDLNFKIYPGILILNNNDSDTSVVQFESEKSIIKNSDIFYLDIKIGDIVNWKGSLYIIFKLECRSFDENTIRCIRGYDTLYLKKKNQTGNLGKKIFITSLASVTFNVNEWTKRPKLNYFEQESLSKKNTPIRLRRVSNHSSPNFRKTTPTIDIITKDQKNDNGNAYLGSKALTKVGSSYKGKENDIFSDCLFIVTGAFPERDKIINIIQSNHGTILNDGFSLLFHYYSDKKTTDFVADEYDLQLNWIDETYSKKYKFACLLSSDFSRSLKYLETLALKWPTLHWKFVLDCMEDEQLLINTIFQYLLPGGYSTHLNSDSNLTSGVLKSSNIFEYFTKTLTGSKLSDMISRESTNADKLLMVVVGNSSINDFVFFSLASFGIRKAYFVKDPDNIDDFFDGFSRKIDDINNEFSGTIFFADGDNEMHSKVIMQSIRDLLSCNPILHNCNFSIENKEWLIQSIINEHVIFKS
ncbi:hypothetical protein TPHA_0C02150 [Tetrapisispora phaffii CBS 4417]|uniref:BRCT domain-containing protein n=1 Tax=Tetrapisispora phaffii (strain ATCC 24235 / CBS 4417 / NBRC 1672 / NRRL Y-8282 / UCD 70-5) TaxID=1071381 RepID=G8BRJ3_TETPH|nr:hypothetical protein TPHA_0C02150 [Tetrapisispora phaffii CBS 4417]CCE62369.1 hypothetical protein TPHA_0C02150 [Tetrapisispora phaffii CBS 4417]